MHQEAIDAIRGTGERLTPHFILRLNYVQGEMFIMQATVNATITEINKLTWKVEGVHTVYVRAIRDAVDPWFNYYILDSLESERVLHSVDDHDSFPDDQAMNEALAWAVLYAEGGIEDDSINESATCEEGDMDDYDAREEGPFGGAFADWDDYYRYIGAI
ncbi:hypothetical protein [Paenibacillus sp. UNC496MF]|uniref:hypothetical protein n=1 Tax=Paenibacillus sp. UNC496MF TaxID=1502753 RepID=UPI001C432F20|nr:hypothetical protein [Paenibacillus sp. UNC496MF]